ncbi:transposase [Reichenbachiella sp. MALMAid0571]|uniref:REP-associated tyrosine transposase n=1 Tax=Reichenbachiella sp. MALMAid0571 TaxID=3143939 RepID=UPI0032DFE431
MKAGTIYFYTATILNWKQLLQVNKRKEIILNSLQYLVEEKAAKVYAYVIMPNHIHLLWKPLENKKFQNVQLSFMRFTAQKLLYQLQDSGYRHIDDFLVESKDRKYQIWQRNPLAVEMYSRKVIEQKLDYIHNNPVQGKWMLVKSPLDYEYSSAQFYESEDLAHPFLTHYMDDI